MSGVGKRASARAFAARKRRKLEHASEPVLTSTDLSATSPGPADSHAFPRGAPQREEMTSSVSVEGGMKNGESMAQLQKMAFGEVEHTISQKQYVLYFLFLEHIQTYTPFLCDPADIRPGKYLAVDCEMVGVGLDGSESVLARVSVVNYYGYVLLDAIVRPRERVVDYRTEFSGIRPSDMVHGAPVSEYFAIPYPHRSLQFCLVQRDRLRRYRKRSLISSRTAYLSVTPFITTSRPSFSHTLVHKHSTPRS